GPITRRFDRWRHPQEYVRAAEISALFDQGRYLPALQERAAMVPGTPAAAMVERRVATEAAKIRSRAIALANHGDYLAAVALVTALPNEGPDGAKRTWLLQRWAPLTSRQLAQHAAVVRTEVLGFAQALRAPMAEFDQIAREIIPRAQHLDPAAATHLGGRVTHPLAPQLMACGVRAAKLVAELKALDAPNPAAGAAKNELMEAADALKRACETCLAYANSAESAVGVKARAAFEDAADHRDATQRMLVALARESTRETAPATPAATPAVRP
ncbi:MAG: hypothetical protein JWM80_6653, partial [Cyanobacteria bacterium RYN_339]|nr:hypothetical protein [Cyanobacteria bacterium RYN_339]